VSGIVPNLYVGRSPRGMSTSERKGRIWRGISRTWSFLYINVIGNKCGQCFDISLPLVPANRLSELLRVEMSISLSIALLCDVVVDYHALVEWWSEIYWEAIMLRLFLSATGPLDDHTNDKKVVSPQRPRAPGRTGEGNLNGF